MRDAYLLRFFAPCYGDRWTRPYLAHNPKIQNLHAFDNENAANSTGSRPSPSFPDTRTALGAVCQRVRLWSARIMAGILLHRGVRRVRQLQPDKFWERVMFAVVKS